MDLQFAGYELKLREGMTHCERALETAKESLERDLEARLRLGFAEMCRAGSLDQQAMTLLEPVQPHYRETGDHLKLAQVLALECFILLTQCHREHAHAMAAELETLVHNMGTSKFKAAL